VWRSSSQEEANLTVTVWKPSEPSIPSSIAGHPAGAVVIAVGLMTLGSGC
jgi:hypothetical protein